MTNPLLENQTLPPFSKIKPEHVQPAIRQLIEQCLTTIETLLDEGKSTWKDLIEPIDAVDDKLSNAWSPVSHMNSVVNTPELREAYNQCLPLLTEYGSKVGQNKRLFEAYKKIKKHEYDQLDQAQKKVIDNAIRDFQLAGVGLEGDDKIKFTELKQELSKLQSQFSDNVMDATDHWFVLIEDKDELKGLPEHALLGAKETAEKQKQTGYRFGLDFPSYLAIMTYAENRELRQAMYRAYTTRASDQGPDAGTFDNSDNMQKIVALRAQVAKLLGYSSYADYSLVTKMASDPKEVIDFLENLARKAKPFAQKDYAALKQFARKEYGINDLEPWDLTFYSEKLRQKEFEISQEELRPYFPEPRVVQGLFSVLEKLYGMKVEEIKEFETWHPEVHFYQIRDEQGTLRGQFYFDLYAREQKRGGAWMDECRVRYVKGNQVQTPVAYLTCNFTRPIGDKPALLTHDEVITLFHEFGHGIHHMLTQIDYPAVSGINGVPWDAVELPSQFMENWCWEEEALALISGHFETGEPLPKDLLNKLKAAKNFQAGMTLTRQLEFALFDFKLHLKSKVDHATEIQTLLDEVRQQYGVVPVPEYNRFQHSFSHIFAGGYAAGYYSYLWAELLASDAYSRFEEEGIFNRETGQSFLTNILEKGGSEEPKELFKAFRGRDPSIEALLRHHGLYNAEQAA